VTGLVVARSEVLAAAADEPLHKPALVDRLPVSRSTVDRAVRELEAAGLVERTGDGVAATLAGRLAVDGFRRTRDRLAAVEDARDLLTGLPPDLDADPVIFEDAEVLRAEEPAPHRPQERLRESVRAAERYRGISDAVGDRLFVEEVESLVVEEGLTVEFILSEAVASYVADEYSDIARTVFDRGDVSLSVVPDVPCGFRLVDLPDRAEVHIQVREDDTIPSGVIINDRPEAVGWGEAFFERHRQRARELNLSDLDPG